MIKHIVIIGGGFAGWYSAVALKNNCPDIKITIIDSDKHPRLGVGETLGFSAPYEWKRLLKVKDDSMLMWRTGSVFKYGTTAHNFYKDQHSISYGKFFNLKVKSLTKFYGEFDYPDFYESWSAEPGDVGVQQAWLSINKDNNKDFSNYVSEVNEAGWFVANPVAPYDSRNNYILRPAEGWAYQIDAEQMVTYLKELAFSGDTVVEHISSPVTKIQLSNKSTVEYLELENQQRVNADLFVDATGNARVLMKQSENDTWVDMGTDYCNSAWVVPTKYKDVRKELVGATQFYGEDWGWRFKIGLYHRMGNGYIFNDNLTDSDIPLKRILEISEGARLADPKKITWTPGYYTEPWQGNVLALGISSHLIDPFDAPTFDVQSQALNQLIKCLNDYDEDTVQTYNKQNSLVVEERNIRLHFTFGISQKTGEFWDSRRALFNKHHSMQDLSDIISGNRCDLQSRLPHFWQQMYFRMIMAAGLDRTKLPSVELTDSDYAMAKSFFEYNAARNKYISQQQWPNYYEWLKTNRFNNHSSEEVLEMLNPQWVSK